jgi:hypothetical protein
VTRCILSHTPGDLALVPRAVINDWPISQAMRDQICDQIDGAIKDYREQLKAHPRGITHMLKLGKLLKARLTKVLARFGVEL